MVVLILVKSLLQDFHPQRQWCSKIGLSWVQKFYTHWFWGEGQSVCGKFLHPAVVCVCVCARVCVCVCVCVK